MNFIKRLPVLAIAVLLLNACVVNTSSKATQKNKEPLEQLANVIVCFNKITLIGSPDEITLTVGSDKGAIPANELCIDDNEQVIPNTVGIDLLDFTGAESIKIMQSISIPQGKYTQMSVFLEQGSYAVSAKSGKKYPVTVPSNELLLGSLNVLQGGEVDFYLEFDAPKAMAYSVENAVYTIHPKGVRLVDNS